MRKYIMPFLVIAVLVLAIVLLPFASGLVAKREIQKFIQTTLPPGMSIKLENYHMRWYESTADLDISVDDSNRLLVDPSQQDGKLHVQATLFVKHGPIWRTAEDGIQIGFARMDFASDASDITGLHPKLAQYLASLFPEKPVLEATALVRLSRTLFFTFKSNPVSATQGENVLTWNGFKGKARISHHLNRADIDVEVFPILLKTSDKTTLETASITLGADLYRTPQNLWMGQQHMDIPSFYMQDATGSVISFKKLRSITKSEEAEPYANLRFTLKATKVVLGHQQIPSAEIKVELNRLDATSLAKMKASALMEDDDERKREWLGAFVTLFSQGAEIHAEHNFDVEEGNWQSALDITFPNVSQKEVKPFETLTQALLTQLTGQLSMEAPKQWTKNTLAYLSSPKNISVPTLSVPAATTPSTAAPEAENKTLAQDMLPAAASGTVVTAPVIDEATQQKVHSWLQQWINAGLITEKMGDYQFKLEYHNKQFLLNDKPVTQQDVIRLLPLLVH